MNILKFKKIILAVLFIQFCGTNTMKAVAINAPVETYFLPQDQQAMNQKILELLDNAKNQILIAMYWITDPVIVEKLIALKQRDVDVQIVYDESSADSTGLMNYLVGNNIFPYIFPSEEITGIGKMHNKFFVIDSEVVWMGSANFTKTVLNPGTKSKNNETVSIFYSQEISKLFTNAFFEIIPEVADLYINQLATRWPNDLPDWIVNLSIALYNNDQNFANHLVGRLAEFNPTQQNRLLQYFPDLEITPTQGPGWEPPTQKQSAYLKSRGMFDEEMSKQQAFELIGNIMQQERQIPF